MSKNYFGLIGKIRVLPILDAGLEINRFVTNSLTGIDKKSEW